ncbi:MAG: hypothetical protein OK439_04570 [Thaumarchaeota archaeon]|nr:hypothetical protein [Nitrososphaerota archaeon]
MSLKLEVDEKLVDALDDTIDELEELVELDELDEDVLGDDVGVDEVVICIED